jgi:hypothetical protein
MQTFQIEIVESGHKFVEIIAMDAENALKTAQEEYRQGDIIIDPRHERITDFYLARE